MANKQLRITSLKERFTAIHPREYFSNLKKSKRYNSIVSFMQRKPFTAFVIGLALLFGIIALGNIVNSLNKEEVHNEQIVKEVEVHSLTGMPSVTVQGKVEKEGVIQILAQSPGIVQRVNVAAGDSVQAGQVFVTLASNYQGGNAPALQAGLAQAQYDNTTATYTTQKEIIQKQREVADKTESNAEELRKIASDSAGGTQSLLELNQTILRTLQDQLRNLENTNTNGVNDTQILALRTQISPVQSGVVQLESQLRNLNYQKDSGKPAAELGILQRDITKKQLEVQEKALELGLKTSRIQRDLAWVQASLMTPAAPCNGVVEKIFVKAGDTVNPGDPIATIKTDNTDATLEALIPADMAFLISQSSSSSAEINGKNIAMNPLYVSREATDGQLYSVLFNLPEDVTKTVTQGQFLPVVIPLSVATSDVEPFVPLDAVYQTQNEAYVFVVQGNKALSKKVTLGNVLGKFVVVTDGLDRNEKIILNRNIVSGEAVRIKN